MITQWQRSSHSQRRVHIYQHFYVKMAFSLEFDTLIKKYFEKDNFQKFIYSPSRIHIIKVYSNDRKE